MCNLMVLQAHHSCKCIFSFKCAYMLKFYANLRNNKTEQIENNGSS